MFCDGCLVKTNEAQGWFSSNSWNPIVSSYCSSSVLKKKVESVSPQLFGWWWIGKMLLIRANLNGEAGAGSSDRTDRRVGLSPLYVLLPDEDSDHLSLLEEEILFFAYSSSSGSRGQSAGSASIQRPRVVRVKGPC